MNIFVWVFSLLMWHMMARSISISSFALHNIKRGVYDSIQFKYENYCRQLQALAGRHEEAAKKYLRFSRFRAHGIRKGSGTHASSSATTLPPAPAFTSVAARGEWSLGRILDIYFQFAMGGGRLLTLMDPDDPLFNTLLMGRDYYLGQLLTLIDPRDQLSNTLPRRRLNEVRRANDATSVATVAAPQVV